MKATVSENDLGQECLVIEATALQLIKLGQACFEVLHDGVQAALDGRRFVNLSGSNLTIRLAVLPEQSSKTATPDAPIALPDISVKALPAKRKRRGYGEHRTTLQD